MSDSGQASTGTASVLNQQSNNSKATSGPEVVKTKEKCKKKFVASLKNNIRQLRSSVGSLKMSKQKQESFDETSSMNSELKKKYKKHKSETDLKSSPSTDGEQSARPKASKMASNLGKRFSVGSTHKSAAKQPVAVRTTPPLPESDVKSTSSSEISIDSPTHASTSEKKSTIGSKNAEETAKPLDDLETQQLTVASGKPLPESGESDKNLLKSFIETESKSDVSKADDGTVSIDNTEKVKFEFDKKADEEVKEMGHEEQKELPHVENKDSRSENKLAENVNNDGKVKENLKIKEDEDNLNRKNYEVEDLTAQSESGGSKKENTNDKNEDKVDKLKQFVEHESKSIGENESKGKIDKMDQTEEKNDGEKNKADDSEIPQAKTEKSQNDDDGEFTGTQGLPSRLSPGALPKIPASMTQVPEKRECLYKILVIGELGTGKTSIIKRYVHQFFSQHYRATIGVDFALKVLNWDPNTIIRLQLWDIAGQERFGNMTRVYYKEAVGAFIVFDVTRSATFDAVLKWKQDLDAKVQLADGASIPCVLLANKCDQQKEGIINSPIRMEEYCKEHNFSGWFETSAKENINIDEAAKNLVTQILQNDKVSQNGRETRDASKFPLEGKGDQQEKKSCSC